MKMLEMPENGEDWKELRLSRGLNFNDIKKEIGSAFMSCQWRLERGEGVGYWKALTLFEWLMNKPTKIK